MTSLYRQFIDLLPQDRIVYAQVVSVSGATGTSLVQTPNGRQFRVIGTGIPAGSYCFVRGGEIKNVAVELPLSSFNNA